MKLSKNINTNMALMQEKLSGCEDIKCREMSLGKDVDVKACIYYIEVAIDNITVEDSVIGKMLSKMMDMDRPQMYEFLEKNSLGVSDIKQMTTVDDAILGIMIGDGIVFVDGYDKAIKIKIKGYPSMGVTEATNEKVMRGSREGFADSVKTNTALLRKRLRSHNLKVKEKTLGSYSNTKVAIAYVDGIARQSVLDEIDRRLEKIDIDGLTDTGIIEQLTEENVWSPFPQYQTTERPDKAAEELLAGRVIVLVDNTPISLLLPTNYSSFFQTADDYYNRFEIVSFERIIRYIASFIAFLLPAFYLAVVNFHPELVPTPLLISLISARSSVPFSGIVEVLFMELSFELLREAGIRIPGYAGNAIGIVGGLIVGQAAVNAGVVSPIIVIVVALTALASFAIPNEELASAFRLIKYAMIFAAAIFGIYGIILGIILAVAHLSRLKSFNFPYMYPFTGGDIYGDKDMKDTIIRGPRELFKKKLYAKRDKRSERR